MALPDINRSNGQSSKSLGLAYRILGITKSQNSPTQSQSPLSAGSSASSLLPSGKTPWPLENSVNARASALKDPLAPPRRSNVARLLNNAAVGESALPMTPKARASVTYVDTPGRQSTHSSAVMSPADAKQLADVFVPASVASSMLNLGKPSRLLLPTVSRSRSQGGALMPLDNGRYVPLQRSKSGVADAMLIRLDTHGSDSDDDGPSTSAPTPKPSMRKLRRSENGSLSAPTQRRTGLNEVILPGTRTSRMMRAGATASDCLSIQGVELNVLLKFADSIPGRPTTAEVVKNYIMPQTKGQKCRLSDQYNSKGTPDYYVIHAWQADFKSMVETIKVYLNFVRQPTKPDIYLWIDFFCINQHVELTGVDLIILFDIQTACDKTMLILDRQGAVLNRTWAMYELWPVAVAEQPEQRLVVLPASWSWRELELPFQLMDLARVQASKAKEQEMLMSELTIRAGPHMPVLMQKYKDIMLAACRREAQRSEKLALVSPRHYILANSNWAALLFLHGRYTEAEETLRNIQKLMDKVYSAGCRDVTEKEEACAKFFLSMVIHNKGELSQSERLLHGFSTQFRGMNDELYVEGVSALVDVLVATKQFTKAEMLCRKNIITRETLHGTKHPGTVKALVQMAAIASAQRLYDESIEHLSKALELATAVSGADSADAANCLHLLALCSYFSKRHDSNLDEDRHLIEKALAIRTRLYGVDHPTTLETRSLEATIMQREGKLADAEQLLSYVYKAQLRVLGPEHQSTLETMGALADVLRKLQREPEAEEIETKLYNSGRNMLKGSRVDKTQSLQFLASFFVQREYLMERASMFLMKAFATYKEKLTAEHDLTISARRQLGELVLRACNQGQATLESAEIFRSVAQFKVAEVMFRQAWSINKLIMPDKDHKVLAQGLADALFGQNRVPEAKTVLRQAGLTKAGMKSKIPASYLRWLNKRVAKFMDRENDKDDDDDDDDDDGDT